VGAAVSILTDSWEPVQPYDAFGAFTAAGVSILTDSWEPVQHRRTSSAPAVPIRFNPHRLLGAGATSEHYIELAPHAVSILTDSWEPVQLSAIANGLAVLRVSILTDSWEPVQPIVRLFP